MRSRPEHRKLHVLTALALTAQIAAAPVLAAAPPRGAPPPASQVPSTEQIAAAMRAIRKDPNLGGMRKERTLHWVNDNERPRAHHSAVWIEWIAGLFAWFARTSRFLVWAAVVVLVGFLGIFLVRLLRERPARAAADRFTPPTHVRDLDIRPESLPDDIGAAARQLWQSGERRAALALLYRGLISRLVHVYGVPIRASSTEGDCLALAAPRLDESPRRYASRLIRIWQLAVYGGHEPPSDTITALCEEFAGALPSRASPGRGRRAVNLRIIWRIAVLIAAGAFVYWIATHTYWADQMVARGPSGQALSEPFYVAERLSKALGARASYERLWKLPDTNAVVVAESWDWDRSSTERAQLQHWVESGGRLVTDLSFFGYNDTFSAWSGVKRRYPKPVRKEKSLQTVVGGNSPGRSGTHGTIVRLPAARSVISAPPECHNGEESGASLWPATATRRHYDLCGIYGFGFLASTRAPVWQVADGAGVQALRIKVGQGSVSVVNGEPFTYLNFLQGTNAVLFVAATQLHAGDEIYFLTDQDHASLLALSWRFGAPVIALLLGALIFALWRAAPRFGPAMASPESARRSLAEQIRGTGQFLLRVGDGQALHAATVRALFAAAPRRISAFANLSSAERASRLARVTGFSAEALAEAINYTGARRTNELRSTIALLEAARREILRNKDRSTDGN